MLLPNTLPKLMIGLCSSCQSRIFCKAPGWFICRALLLNAADSTQQGAERNELLSASSSVLPTQSQSEPESLLCRTFKWDSLLYARHKAIQNYTSAKQGELHFCARSPSLRVSILLADYLQFPLGQEPAVA